MNLQTVAKTALLNPHGKVLLLKRSLTDVKRPGEWDFAGGQIDPGEEISQGAIREILEETGIKLHIADLTLVYAGTVAYDELSVTRLLFLAKAPSLDITLSEEHEEFAWVDSKYAIEKFPHPFYSVGLKYAQDHELLKF